MTRLPRITGLECVHALQKAGFSVERIRGSHHILTGSQSQVVIVPCHGAETLGPGILVKILRLAGLTRADLEDLLRR